MEFLDFLGLILCDLEGFYHNSHPVDCWEKKKKNLMENMFKYTGSFLKVRSMTSLSNKMDKEIF